MGWTTAAIIGSAVIGGMASSKAAKSQAGAAAAAGAVSERQYDQTREDLAPWRAVGGQAAREMGALYNLPYANPAAPGNIGQNGAPGHQNGFANIKNSFGNKDNAAGQFDQNSVATTGDPRYINGEMIMNNDPRYADADPFMAIAPIQGQSQQSYNPATGAQEFYSSGDMVASPMPTDPRFAQLPSNQMARYGRGGDTRMAHVTPGETVVPRSVANNLPGGRNALVKAFQSAGADPGRYVVGGSDDSINPNTGAREYFAEDTPSGGLDDVGNDFNDAGLGSERELGGRGEGKDPSDLNRFRMNNTGGNNLFNPTRDPIGIAQPDDYYTQENAMARFYDSPDYNINFDEGAKALERSAAARGGLFSGNTGTALARYGQDYGNRLYNQYANRLSSMAGFGQTAATNTGQFGAQAAAQQGNAMMAGGNAGAQGWYGLNNAIQGGMQNYYTNKYLNSSAVQGG